ncbi:hypothetical protein N7540_005346 [Penicillium herquei]|nr:hypothetical protein N7540_005346 [Penicillium herquei]
MIHVAGNVSFNGLIYPRSEGKDTNAKLRFEVLEGGASLIARFLCESHVQHKCVVDGPNIERNFSEIGWTSSNPGLLPEQGASGGTHHNGPQTAALSPRVSPRATPALPNDRAEGISSVEPSTATSTPEVSSHTSSEKLPEQNVGGSSAPAMQQKPGLIPTQAQVLFCMSRSASRARSGDDLVNAILDLKVEKFDTGAIQHYKVEQLRKFDSDPTWYESKSHDQAETIVIEGPTKSNIQKCTKWLMEAKGKKTIYKMTRPLARGPIWDHIRRKDYSQKNTQAQLFVVVDANDLRAEGLDISRHLSWESTAQTFVKHAASTHWLHSLMFCPYLIVLFGCEGVIYCKEGKESTLFFDPKNAEGDFASHHSSGMVDVTGAFIAGFASAISNEQDVDSSLPKAIRQGLTSARRLVEVGFISFKDEAPDYPVKQVMAKEGRTWTISSIRIPREHIDPNSWSIFLNLMGDTTEIARFIVRNGPGNVLSRVQTAQFGKLMTADRQEMEGFRAITNLVEEYIHGSKIEPLSIGVFGPPGCGKSFALTQVITGAPHTSKIEKLVFNVSQFNQYSDLLSAFQKIRDVVLSGSTPMALFDEFDTSFGTTKLGWLRYFLAPMQDGHFLEQGQTHPLGRSIFVFMGGTSAKFADFAKCIYSENPSSEDAVPNNRAYSETQTQDGNTKQEFILVKGPDFVSRLRGYVDIRGPDRIDEHDRMYSIRRAILLRALLEQRMDMSSYHLHVDDTVLSGLLKVPKFNHGARSLEAILDMSRVSKHREFERAALPSAQQLRLHVKSKEFMHLVQTKDGLSDLLHENVSRKIKERLSILRTKSVLSDWGQEILASYDTHTAANDIVRKLRSINRYIVPKPSYLEESLPPSPESQWTDDENEQLASEDYERYLLEISNKHESGNNRREKRPALWKEEDEDIRGLFIDLVRSIPRIMEECDCLVSSLEIGAPIATKVASISNGPLVQ